MSEEKMLHEAVEAITKGERSRAKDLLTRLLRADQTNPDFWVWMSAVVDTASERKYCLENALRINPNNHTAQRGLVMMGGRTPEAIVARPPLKRRWETAIKEEEKEETPKKGFRKWWANRLYRALIIAGSGLLVIGIILVGVLVIPNLGKNKATPKRPLNTSSAQMPVLKTPTPLPTNTLVVRSPTPTFMGPTPLWMFLDATYTPAPPYINTPHPIIDDYRMAMRNYAKGDYQGMLTYMNYAAKLDPQAADLRFYIGEAYRLLGDNQNALDNYLQATKLNAYFAPAWLGMARVQMAIDPKADVEKEFSKAIELDPNYPDIYLVRSQYYANKGDYVNALNDLETAASLAPESPMLYVERSLVHLKMGDVEKALQDAQRAHELDFTLLPAYAVLAQAYMANNQPAEALKYARTYVVYVDKDPQAWLLLGRAYLSGQDYTSALDACDKALALDARLADGYYYRGLIYLAMKDGKAAVNDLADAQRFNSNSFDINLAMGQALMLAERYEDAYRQLKSMEPQAVSDQQRATLYYWRAQVAEAYGFTTAALQDWESLLALPVEAYPEEWAEMAQEHLDILHSYTGTPTQTLVPSSTVTPPPTAIPGTTTTTPSPPPIVAPVTPPTPSKTPAH